MEWKVKVARGRFKQANWQLVQLQKRLHFILGFEQARKQDFAKGGGGQRGLNQT